jgi:hypothetical protein
MQIVTLAKLFQGLKPKLSPLVSLVKKASRVEVRASHQKGAGGAVEELLRTHLARDQMNCGLTCNL